MELDQYFTKPKVAKQCYNRLINLLPPASSMSFIEPSAGSGSFFNILPAGRRTGLDIAPLGRGIQQADFLAWNPKKISKTSTVVIGNPPFGHRSRLAIDFFNHSAEMADTIAFIVPRQFQKYSVHSRLAEDFRLVDDNVLGEDSFFTPDGKNFDVRCVFQVWSRLELPFPDQRIVAPPPIAHEDFDMHLYNNTPQALKVFRREWDFAVPRQGYEDYRRREKESRYCEKNKQWMLFKPRTKEVFRRLWNFDFYNLAKRNTVILGYGKADVVDQYKKLYA